MITLFGGNQNIELRWWTFPGGERNVKIVDTDSIVRFGSFTVYCDYRGNRFSTPIKVNSPSAVTEEELRRMCGNTLQRIERV